MLRPTTSIPLTVARDAMWSVGSICQQFPDDTIGLAAWLTHAADRFDDPAITTFAAHSLVAAGAHPSRISEARRDAVQTDCGLDIVTWADYLPLSR